MKKLTTVYVLGISITYESFRIEDFLKIINDAKDNGATNVDFNTEVEYDSPTCTMSIYYDREETDEEYRDRLKQEQQTNERQRQSDLKEFERLKNKLAKNNF